MLLLSILLPAGTASTLAGQQEAGDKEVQLTGSVISVVGQDDRSTTSGILQAKVGYFLTDRVEIGGFPSLTFTRTTIRSEDWPDVPDQTIDETKFGMGLFSTYSFLASDAATVPYLGGQFYRIDLTDDEERGWLGANGGLKYYANPRTAFDVGGNVLLNLGERGGVLLLFQFGLSYLL